ncbi:MAG: hypothetical protein WDW38_000511 [Sanguina aurantia]
MGALRSRDSPRAGDCSPYGLCLMAVVLSSALSPCAASVTSSQFRVSIHTGAKQQESSASTTHQAMPSLCSRLGCPVSTGSERLALAAYLGACEMYDSHKRELEKQGAVGAREVGCREGGFCSGACCKEQPVVEERGQGVGDCVEAVFSAAGWDPG